MALHRRFGSRESGWQTSLRRRYRMGVQKQVEGFSDGSRPQGEWRSRLASQRGEGSGGGESDREGLFPETLECHMVGRRKPEGDTGQMPQPPPLPEQSQREGGCRDTIGSFPIVFSIVGAPLSDLGPQVTQPALAITTTFLPVDVSCARSNSNSPPVLPFEITGRFGNITEETSVTQGIEFAEARFRTYLKEMGQRFRPL